MDLKSYSRWYDYSRARDDMFAATDTDFAPWFVARSDDKKKARLNIITDFLSRVPYEEIKREEGEAPEAPEAGRLRGDEAPVPVRRREVLSGSPGGRGGPDGDGRSGRSRFGRSSAGGGTEVAPGPRCPPAGSVPPVPCIERSRPIRTAG